MSVQHTVDRQAQLENRARQLQGVALEGCTDFKQVFGSGAEWVMELGPFRFFLIPFLGEWWFYDEPHGEWRFTGKRLGEVRFVFEEGRLELCAPASEAPVSPVPAKDMAAPTAVRCFCPQCGAQASPDWKFCLACGEKIPRAF